jgi:tRNA-splicing ligase RtcB
MEIIQIDGAKKPIFSWCPDLEPQALDQMKVIAKLPFVVHSALMPDAHMGMKDGAPIGSVIATKGIILPTGCGVDIGCGALACRTSIKAEEIADEEVRNAIHNSVLRGIPMGFSHNNPARIREMQQKYSQRVDYIFEKSKIEKSVFVMANMEEAEKMVYSQLGSLGGGNHGIDIGEDEEGYLWILIHSGSRNIGKRICDRFVDLANNMNNLWYSIDTNGIPFLPTLSQEGQDYIAWMEFGLRFAYLNRFAMMKEIQKDLEHIFPYAKFEGEINIHHNYAALENHYGDNVWVHRKGATEAREKTIGIILGSMATPSYIVKGLGNDKALSSCSHGAGRIMGRNAFNQQFNNEDGIKRIKEAMKGITYCKFGRSTSRKGKDTGMLDLSESPMAYRDIEAVMANEADLVSPIHKLTPRINWKDTGEE